MKIGLAGCGGASARGFNVRVLRWQSLRCISSAGVMCGAVGALGVLGALGGAR
ncbi:MAG: hypothetical protein ACI4BC_10605 [Muribaculaceae bacterium]